MEFVETPTFWYPPVDRATCTNFSLWTVELRQPESRKIFPFPFSPFLPFSFPFLLSFSTNSFCSFFLFFFPLFSFLYSFFSFHFLLISSPFSLRILSLLLSLFSFSSFLFYFSFIFLFLFGFSLTEFFNGENFLLITFTISYFPNSFL